MVYTTDGVLEVVSLPYPASHFFETIKPRTGDETIPYPRRGDYSRFGNRLVCACHTQRSNPSNELAGSGSTEGARTPTPVAASSSTLPVLQPASDRDYIVGETSLDQHYPANILPFPS
ncbi:hypothetical protein SprV_0602243000 [Sparganum proliferum]